MFQYAFARALAIKYKVPIYLDLDHYTNFSMRPYALDIFNLAPDILSASAMEERSLTIEQIIELQEPSYHFNEEATRILDDEPVAKTAVIISGYWQSYKYFKTVQKQILEDFSFNTCLYCRWEDLNRHIKDRNAVMINVRRAEYLTLLDYHGVVSAEYIYHAMEICKQRVKEPFLYVFYDDIPWCRDNIKDA